MAEHEQEQNRNEPPTPFKLKEARERGAVAKSAELAGVVVLLAVAGFLLAGGRATWERLLRQAAGLLSQAQAPALSEAQASAALATWLGGLLDLLMPVFTVVVIAAVLGVLMQTGPAFSFHPLKADFERLNPVAGLERLFSRRLVFETVKNLVKLALFGYAIYALIEGLLPAVLALAQTSPAAYARLGLEHVTALALKLGLVALAIALVDFAYVRWEFMRRMMMSRREVREEHKRREGDPKVRSRMRELQREMRKRASALKRVPEADVLITNPDHLAVALLYRRDEMRAPAIIAKGAGDLAQRMKRLARRHRVPLVENRPLARALFVRGALDAAVPEATYPQVARVLAWVYALREMRAGARA